MAIMVGDEFLHQSAPKGYPLLPFFRVGVGAAEVVWGVGEAIAAATETAMTMSCMKPRFTFIC